MSKFSRHPRVPRSDAKAVADLTAAIERDWEVPILPTVVGALRTFFDADMGCAYRPALSSSGVPYVDFQHMAGGPPGASSQLQSYIESSPLAFSPLYDPRHPPAAQRNKVVLGSEILSREAWEASTMTEHFLRPLGLDHHEQLRVLVCDGPLLLGWVGVLGGERYGRREAAILGALVDPLIRRMRLDKRLREGAVSGAAVDVLLEALDSPAFLLRKDGVVLHANATGQHLLDARVLDLPSRLLAARAGADPGVTIRPIAIPGFGAYELVIIDAARPDLEARLARATFTWRLTARQQAVLRLVVAGDANKTIAERLRSAVVTVEVHVSALLRKAHVENRTALVSSFWMLGPR